MNKYPLVVGVLLLTATTSFAVGTTFTDEASFASWYKDAVKHMQETGVVTGYADGSFQADKNVSRGELSLMLDRYEEKIVDQKIKEALTGASGSIDEAMVDKKIEAYFNEHKDDYFDQYIDNIITNIDLYDGQDFDYKTQIIMAASGMRKINTPIDLATFDVEKIEVANLPEGYEVYENKATDDYGSNGQLPIFIHYKGEKKSGDEVKIVDEWYGDFNL